MNDLPQIRSLILPCSILFHGSKQVQGFSLKKFLLGWSHYLQLGQTKVPKAMGCPSVRVTGAPRAGIRGWFSLLLIVFGH